MSHELRSDPQPPYRPSRITWTADAESRLIALHEAGMGMRRIAAAIGLSRNAVTGCASRLGLREPARPPRECPIESEPDLARAPLPPGHPISWASAAHITRMDQALDWIPLIPRDRYVLRRIVGARALISPTTERHLFTWRRLASLLGADHKAIQRWHAQGIDLMVTAINAIAS